MSRADDTLRIHRPKKIKPGEVPAGRLGVYRADGVLLAHVGPSATSVTAGRFTHRRDMRLGEKNGRAAWLCGSK